MSPTKLLLTFGLAILIMLIGHGLVSIVAQIAQWYEDKFQRPFALVVLGGIFFAVCLLFAYIVVYHP